MTIVWLDSSFTFFAGSPILALQEPQQRLLHTSFVTLFAARCEIFPLVFDIVVFRGNAITICHCQCFVCCRIFVGIFHLTIVCFLHISVGVSTVINFPSSGAAGVSRIFIARHLLSAFVFAFQFYFCHHSAKLTLFTDIDCERASQNFRIVRGNFTNLITRRQWLSKLQNAKISVHIFSGTQCVWLTLKH